MSKFLFLKGKTKWFRPHQPDQWNKWKHVLYPDPESLELIRELMTSKEGVQGIKNILKKDEDGYCLTISRDASKMIKGRVVGFTPPEVLDGSKTLEDGSNPPLKNELVGNGSDIVTKIEYYTYKLIGSEGRGSAIRWISSRVDNLVPFSGRPEFNELEEKKTRGLSEVPKQMF